MATSKSTSDGVTTDQHRWSTCCILSSSYLIMPKVVDPIPPSFPKDSRTELRSFAVGRRNHLSMDSVARNAFPKHQNDCRQLNAVCNSELLISNTSENHIKCSLQQLESSQVGSSSVTDIFWKIIHRGRKAACKRFKTAACSADIGFVQY